jgi:hypothetical protein
VEGRFPVEETVSATLRNRLSRNAISPSSWSKGFIDGGGERVVKYQAGEVGWSQIIDSLKVYSKPVL